MAFERLADDGFAVSPRLAAMIVGRAPQAAVARVAEFDYGAQGRLARVIEHFWRDVGEPGVWDRPSQVCYRYDAHGYPAGQLDGVAGDCAQASWSDAQARYVNADDGRLLRRLQQVVTSLMEMALLRQPVLHTSMSLFLIQI